MNFKLKQIVITMGSIIILIVSGCSTTMTGKGPYSEKTSGAEFGIRYYLPLHSITVNGIVTHEQTNFVKDDLSIATILRLKSSTANVSYKLSADREQFYTLDLKPGWISDDSLSVQLTPNSLLKSINSDSTGKTGEVLVEVGKAAAVVIATVGVLSGNPLTSTSEEGTLSPEVQKFIKEWPGAISLREKANLLQQLINKRKEEIHRLQATYSTVSKEEIDLLTKRINLLEESVFDIEKELAAISATIDANFNLFKEKKNIGVKTFSRPFTLSFALDDLAHDDDFIDGMSLTNVNEMINKKYPKMKELFELTNILITTKINTPYTCNTGADSKNVVANDKDDKMVIFGRMPVPVTVSIYSYGTTAKNSEEEPQDKLNKLSSTVEHMFIKCSPTYAMAYDTNAFAERKIKLSFSDEGVLTQVEKSGTAAGLAAAKGVSNALDHGLSSYDSSISKLKSITEKKAAIDLAKITAQVSELEQQQLLLDRRLAFEGTTATYELALEKRKLDEELNRTRSELELTKAGHNAELEQIEHEKALIISKLALANAEATRSSNANSAVLSAQLEELKKLLELNKLKDSVDVSLEIEKLKQQIELLIQQKKLSEAKVGN